MRIHSPGWDSLARRLRYLADCADTVLFEKGDEIWAASNHGAQEVLKSWQCATLNAGRSHFPQGPEQKQNLWTYNFVEVSGQNPESSQTWGSSGGGGGGKIR
jgi:hypothetical protein